MFELHIQIKEWWLHQDRLNIFLRKDALSSLEMLTLLMQMGKELGPIVWYINLIKSAY